MSKLLKLDEGFLVEVENKRDDITIRTNLSFLNQHGGFRKGKFHLFLGESGGGKSTMFKTMILDFLENNKTKVAGIWLSEEELEDMVAEFSKVKKLRTALTQGKISFFSEIEEKNKAMANLELQLKSMIESVDVIFLDNLTTSKLYQDRPLEKQAKVASSLKSLAKQYKKPLVIFAHTGTGAGMNSLSSQNDIRGSKTIINLSEFIYMVQQLQVEEEKISTIRCVKSRGSVTDKFGYFLEFSSDEMIYKAAVPQDPKVFKTIFKLASKLRGA